MNSDPAGNSIEHSGSPRGNLRAGQESQTRQADGQRLDVAPCHRADELLPTAVNRRQHRTCDTCAAANGARICAFSTGNTALLWVKLFGDTSTIMA